MEVLLTEQKGIKAVYVIRTLMVNVKQSLLNIKFLFVVTAIVILVFSSSYESVFNVIDNQTKISADFKINLLLSIIINETMLFLLPIFSSLPFTTSFIDDIKSGFVKVYLPRTTRKQYVFSKLFACMVSGGLCYVIGILVSYLIMSLLLMPMETLVVEKTIMETLQGNLQGTLVLYFVSGSFWSVIGLTIATVTKSKYMAYASPFIIYYILIILHERYFKDLYVIYPKEWIIPSDKWGIGNLGVILFVTEVIVITSIIFILMAKRRISEL